MQGRDNIMLSTRLAESGNVKEIVVSGKYPLYPLAVIDNPQVSPSAPRLRHLSALAQSSIVAKFASLATSLDHLRIFAQLVMTRTTELASVNNIPKTLEAFAESVDDQTRRFSSWCAAREERIVRSILHSSDSVVVSLLDLESAIRHEFADTYPALLDVLCRSCEGVKLPFDDYAALRDRTNPPSSFASTLLDIAFETTQSYRSMGDNVTASALMQVFVHAAEPMWHMLCQWLTKGIFWTERGAGTAATFSLQEEFFIEQNDLPLADPDFWTDGYNLRSTNLLQGQGSLEVVETSSVPVFLKPIANAILSAGKSIGLLQVLGHDLAQVKNEADGVLSLSFERFMAQCTGALPVVLGDSLSIEDLSLIVYEQLTPICQSVANAFIGVMFNDCDFWSHLFSVENLFLMRKGDSMSEFCDVLFARVSKTQSSSPCAATYLR